MKIAMIGQKGYPARSGGVEKHVEELSRRLAKQGHEVLVFCRSWYVDPSDRTDGVTRVFVSSLHTKHLDAISHTLFSIIKAAWMNAEVFHIHGVGPALLAWLPKLLRPSAKVVVTFHCVDRKHEKWSGFARAMLRLGEHAACRLPDRTITVSKTLAEYCRLSFGVEPRYIPNGVSAPMTFGSRELHRFGLSPNAYFVMVSRLVRHKGAHTLIAAWKMARKQRPDLFANKKLAIVGNGAFTDTYVRELQTMRDGDDSIVMTGEQTGRMLAELFGNACALVHPSVSEGMPLSVLEAMSYGVCPLVSDIPEHLEVLAEHGMTFRAEDVNDLAARLIMIAEAPEEARQVGQEAARYVRNNYDWDEIALQTEMTYKQLLQPKRQPFIATYRTHTVQRKTSS
jgi:glycosyltransferase involved in cell wall biosynthesis